MAATADGKLPNGIQVGGPRIQETLPDKPQTQVHGRFREFDLQNRVYAVTGGARGLGLAMAEALVEAGAEVHCLDRLPLPDDEFLRAKQCARSDYGGSLHYRQIDVRDERNIDTCMKEIAALHSRLDGLIAAAGVNHVDKAIAHTTEDINEVMSINYTGVFVCATAAARQMMLYRCRGAILLVASMSGIIANKGMISPVYNSLKGGGYPVNPQPGHGMGQGQRGRRWRDSRQLPVPRTHYHTNGRADHCPESGLQGHLGVGEHARTAGPSGGVPRRRAVFAE